MSETLQIILGALAAGAFAWASFEGVNRRPALGVGALFLYLAALVLFTENPEFFVRSLGGINVTPPDVICALLGGIAVLRIAQRRAAVARGLAPVLAVFLAMLLVSYLRGLGQFGLQHATNEFREFFYFLAALGFTLSFPAARLAENLPRLAVAGGFLLMLVALIRLPQMAGFGLEERAVPSYAALALGQAFFFGWCWLRTGGPARARWPVFALLPFSLLMLHRSVWMALAAGLAALVVLDHAGRARLVRTLAIGTALAAVVVALFFREAVAAGLDGAVVEATSSEQSTFMWRVQGWTALLQPAGGNDSWSWLVGQPMGSGYARILGDSAVNSAEIEAGVIPHNYYLSLWLRGGVIGLGAFVLLYVLLFRALRARAQRDPSDAYAPCFLVILCTQLVYFVPYSADFIQGIFLGGAIAVAGAPRESS